MTAGEPDPRTARTPREFREHLKEWRAARPGLSLNELTRRVQRHGGALSRAVIGRVFQDAARQDTLPQRDYVERVVVAGALERCPTRPCACRPEEVEVWLAAWDALDRLPPDPGHLPPVPGLTPRDRGRPSVPVIGGAVLVVVLAVVAVLVTVAVSRSSRPPDAGTVSPAGGGGGDSALPCRAGVSEGDVIDSAPLPGDEARRVDPVLDFGHLRGSAWYRLHRGEMYYWGRGYRDRGLAGTGQGGIRLDWRRGNGPWHTCDVPVTAADGDGKARTPAVRKVIGGVPVTIRICLWASSSTYTEECTAPL
ncbi:hypothetical protein [Streptosporangium longisporum]|uniref:XRE family transcriptional regulator n=1 Tax=Streptosporangium longisporum TaxID=46187 RepID=A0ABN3YEW3_9ACTN